LPAAPIFLLSQGTGPMGLKTPYYDKHVEAGARVVDFGGWDMPLHYGSQKEEHHAVRQNAGVFDVSHMTIVDLLGERAREFLQHLVANDVAKLKDYGKALYTAMLNEDGPTPDAPFDGFEVLRPARDFKNRHPSILLALEATLGAMQEAEKAACA